MKEPGKNLGSSCDKYALDFGCKTTAASPVSQETVDNELAFPLSFDPDNNPENKCGHI